MRSCYLLPESRSIADLSEMAVGLYELNRICVLPRYRGKGFGSQLLEMVCVDADAERSMVQLLINPYGPLDHGQLRDWYERYGWQEDFTRGYMIRYPK